MDYDIPVRSKITANNIIARGRSFRSAKEAHKFTDRFRYLALGKIEIAHQCAPANWPMKGPLQLNKTTPIRATAKAVLRDVYFTPTEAQHCGLLSC